jgi:hypothetical protein
MEQDPAETGYDKLALYSIRAPIIPGVQVEPWIHLRK